MHGPLNVTFLSIQFPSVDWGKSQQHSITTADAPTEMRTGCLPNTWLYHSLRQVGRFHGLNYGNLYTYTKLKIIKSLSTPRRNTHGTGGTEPLILDVANKWNLFMSFTSWLLNTRGKRLGALSRSEPLGGKKISFHSKELNHDSAVFQPVV
jgi:hypothetical protein